MELRVVDHEEEAPAPGNLVVFERLRAEAFRGFNSPVDIDLSASVVIVYGPNGMGKTSLFDALQWVLLGDLPRLRTARLKQTDEYIVNAHRPGQQATVNVQLRLQGQSVRLTRIGNRSGSSLTWDSAVTGTLRGEQAESALAQAFGGGPDLDLTASLNACGLLQQDAAREVLSSKPRDRFDTFSQLLGLGELADIQHWAQVGAAEAAAQFKSAEQEALTAEHRAATAAARLAGLRENAAARPAVADVAGRLRAAVESVRFTLAQSIETRDSAAAIAAFATTAAREAADVAGQLRRLAAEVGLPPMSEPSVNHNALVEVLGEAQRRLATARVDLQQALDELHRLQEGQASFARMASAVLPHVTSPACPVCGQRVDEDELRLRLIELEGTLSTTDAQARAAERAQAVEVAEAGLSAAFRAEQDRIAERMRRQQWQQELDRAASRVAALVAPSSPLRLPAVSTQLLEAAPALDSVADGATTVAALARELVSVWDASASSEEARVSSDAERAGLQLELLQARREGLARARNEAATLHEAVRQARLDVVRHEFARLSPLAQDIYSRLDPHPTFQDIDLVSELFRSAGTTVAQVRDPVTGIAADPMLVFSSAQANIAAISYVMALNAASSVGAPVLLLDEPMQAMDEVNVLGCADLCRHVRRHRQLIVSTHERRFAHLLERKLAPRRWEERTVAVEFVGWDRSGPMLKPRDVPDQRDQIAPAFSLTLDGSPSSDR